MKDYLLYHGDGVGFVLERGIKTITLIIMMKKYMIILLLKGRYLRLYYYQWVDTSAGWLLFSEGLLRLLVSL
jgi:hypothetical protein